MRRPDLTRRLVPQLRSAGGRSADASGPLGSLDVPGEDERYLDDGPVQLSGWAAPRSGSASVQLRLDGSVVAETVPTLPRPDVAAIHGDTALQSGWRLGVTLGPVHDGAQWSVVAADDGGTTSLGQGTVRARPGTAPDVTTTMTGHLDLPIDGQVAAGPVVEVSGWVLDGDRLADVIEIFVDDRPPILAQRCGVRPDVAEMHTDNGVTPGVAIAAGFHELLILDDQDGRDHTVIRARARGRDSVWHSEPVVVRHAPPRPDGSANVAPSPFYVGPAAAPATNGRKRVCALTHSLQLGGGELYLQELLLRLAAADVADFRVISQADGPLRAELERAGIPVHITSHYPVDAAHYFGRREELTALLRSWSCDVAIANTLGVFPAVDAALQAGIPVAWAVHESYPLKVFSYLNWGERGLEPEIQERWLQSLTGSEVVFEAEATLELMHGQVPGLRGRCVRYGIDLAAVEAYTGTHDRGQLRAELGLRPEDRVLLCMGVLQERKAQLALVQAFAEVAAAEPDAVLVLVGFHPSLYANCVRAAVEDLGLGDRVRIIDIAPDTHRWYRCADVLVSASDVESLPRSMLEALAFGVPVLAADVFGVSEVIEDGVNGWLFKSRDGASMVAGLRRVLACSAEELAAMTATCREHAREFDGSNYADAYTKILADLDARALL
jgi:D-inositol-3-phosphate glycosyltransferase